MKLLKKYLFIIGIFTIFLITPLSIQLQKIPINTQVEFTKKQVSFNLSIKPQIANAQSQSKAYSVKTEDGLLNCHIDSPVKFSFSCSLVNFTYMITVQAGNYLVGMSAKLMEIGRASCRERV